MDPHDPNRDISASRGTTTTKRQRDYQEQLTQKPPQTRRMMGMGLGEFVESRSSSSSSSSGSSSGSSSSVRLFSTGEIDALGCAAEPKSPARAESSSSVSTHPPQGTGSIRPVVAAVNGSEGAGAGPSDGVPAASSGGSFIVQSVTAGGISIPTKSAIDVGGPIGGGGGGGAGGNETGSDPSPWVYTVEGEAVDDNELGHRMSYLQMRGFDRAILDLMDESLQGIFEESDLESCEHEGCSDDKVESERAYRPCDPPAVAQPAVVTPERA